MQPSPEDRVNCSVSAPFAPFSLIASQGDRDTRSEKMARPEEMARRRCGSVAMGSLISSLISCRALGSRPRLSGLGRDSINHWTRRPASCRSRLDDLGTTSALTARGKPHRCPRRCGAWRHNAVRSSDFGPKRRSPKNEPVMWRSAAHQAGYPPLTPRSSVDRAAVFRIVVVRWMHRVGRERVNRFTSQVVPLGADACIADGLAGAMCRVIEASRAAAQVATG
jgi:hypothetical protein